ncbi:MAG: 3-deoxy-manno-octulosonate cytidylyltransferase [Candidatus Krumholzibacteriia bacterium]
MPERVLVVIPARYGSSRFPGKALADLGGRPLVVRTVECALRMREADEVVVATDDRRIEAAVRAAGHACVMTGDHKTGTDRIGEVLAGRSADLVVNLQGDEPLLDPAVADRLVRTLREAPAVALATCAHPFADADTWRDPNVVKVLVDQAGRALYFSRAPIPGQFPAPTATEPPFRLAQRHVGIYGWRAAALREFLAWPQGALERIEGLEQLRALEHGLAIVVIPVAAGPVGVDTPDDLERVRALWHQRNDGGAA